MDSAKSQLIERIKSANTILVTVSKNPSVDQLAACIGLTLVINKLNKHGSAVYSGQTPSTIEFLKPEDTIEKNTDSLRDFIIALDKEKADKLRYKVEDQTVRIFITPYRTSLDESDLEFSQGDFNVELIIALGVKAQEDLDQAITAHGRILHDATVASLNIDSESNLGSINWSDPQASSLCEIVADITKLLGDDLLDEQISTALLTGIVAETERFSNQKTSSQTMSTSSALMAAGANQQLVATELEEGDDNVVQHPDEAEAGEITVDEDGTLNIEHSEQEEDSDSAPEEEVSLPEPTVEADEKPELEAETQPDKAVEADDVSKIVSGDVDTKFVSDPPQLGAALTANTEPEPEEPSTDPLSVTSPMQPALTPTEPAPGSFTPPPPAWVPPTNDNQPEMPEPSTTANAPDDATLTEIEESVNSPHLHESEIDNARSQVDAVIAQSEQESPPPMPNQSINAMPLGEPLHPDPAPPPVSDPPLPVDQQPPPPPPLVPPNDAIPPVPPPIPVPPYSYDNQTNSPPPPPPPANS